MDVYTDDNASRTAIPDSPTDQAQSSASSSQRQSPATWTYYQLPQPQPREQQQLPAWMRSAPSPVKTSSNTSTSPGISRASSRAANVGMGSGMNMEPITNVGRNTGTGMGGANTAKGGFNNAGGRTLRRKMTRHPTRRRVTAYEDDDGDDGFVTGECDEFEMANIRVKVRPCGCLVQENADANRPFVATLPG